MSRTQTSPTDPAPTHRVPAANRPTEEDEPPAGFDTQRLVLWALFLIVVLVVVIAAIT